MHGCLYKNILKKYFCDYFIIAHYIKKFIAIKIFRF
jgi:hypothetical protein